MSKQVPTYRLYREKSGESGDFWIHCETIPARTKLHDWHISRHRHETLFQIFHLTAGHGEIEDERTTRILSAPSAIFIPPGAIHGFQYSMDVDGYVVTALADRLYPIITADRRIASFAAETRIVPLTQSDPDAAFAGDCIRRLHDELTGIRAGRMMLLEPLMTAAVIALARIAGAEQADAASDRDHQRVEALNALLLAHFRSHKPVEFYAREIGVSPTHLNRLARAHTGMSVMELASRHIVQAAQRDLVFTPTSVQAIAYSLGYSDPAYFNRFFQRHVNMTPGKFREHGRARLNNTVSAP